MKNNFYVLMLALCLASPCFSQMKAGATFGMQFPTGDFADANFGVGWGIGATGKYFFKDNMSAGILLHYSSFNQRNYVFPGFAYTNYNARTGVTSFTFLFDYYFAGEKIKPFIGVEFGIFAVRYHFNYTYTTFVGNPIFGSQTVVVNEKGTDSDTYAGIVIPAVGIAYPINEKLELNANMKYNIIFGSSRENDNLTYIGINFGLLYNIGE